MSAARIDPVARLELLAKQARDAGQDRAADALRDAARMTAAALALARASEKETLRDRMAMAALPAVLAAIPEPIEWSDVAFGAYRLADAMLIERGNIQ